MPKPTPPDPVVPSPVVPDPVAPDPVASDPAAPDPSSSDSLNAIIGGAAKSLEYLSVTPPPPAPPPSPPPPPTPPPPAAAPAPAAAPQPKDPPPKDPPAVDATPPPKVKSKREIFAERADSERVYREKERGLKEREAAAQAAESRLKDFQSDPIGYLEKVNPRAYQEWTERNLAAGATPEKTEAAALRAEITALREEIRGGIKNGTEQQRQVAYQQYMGDVRGILAAEDFKPVHEDAALHQAFHGRPVDLEQAVSTVWAEYHTKYGKDLTARECCEILLEDAQAHLDSVPPAALQGLLGDQQQLPPAEPPTKVKTPPPTGKTLTGRQETDGTAAPEIDYSKFSTKEQLIEAVSKSLEYEEPPAQQ